MLDVLMVKFKGLLGFVAKDAYHAGATLRCFVYIKSTINSVRTWIPLLR